MCSSSFTPAQLLRASPPLLCLSRGGFCSGDFFIKDGKDKTKVEEGSDFALKMRGEESIRQGEEEKSKKIELIKENIPSTSLEVNVEDGMTEFPGFPIPLSPSTQNTKSGGVTFVLEKASLSLAFVGKRYQILNPEEHAAFLRKKNMDPYIYRPDIVHEALCEIMNSWLCMAGRLRAVYIKTNQGVLTKVEPNALIPRTLGRFCSMMAELLQKFKIKSKGNHGKLLHLVKNPVTQHLPANSRKIGLSFSSKKAVDIRDYGNGIRNDEDLVFVVGAMAHGKIDNDYTDDLVSVFDLPLSAEVCLSCIRLALERRWNIC